MNRLFFVSFLLLTASSLMLSCDRIMNVPEVDSDTSQEVVTPPAVTSSETTPARLDYGERSEAIAFLEDFYKRYIPMCMGNKWDASMLHSALTPELDKHMFELFDSHTLDWDPLIEGQDVPESLRDMKFTITPSNDRGWYSLDFDNEHVLIQVLKIEEGYRINDIAIGSGGTVMTMQVE